jgi:hypothetical protein
MQASEAVNSLFARIQQIIAPIVLVYTILIYKTPLRLAYILEGIIYIESLILWRYIFILRLIIIVE